MNPINIKLNQTNAFQKGLLDGVIAFSLDFNNVHDTYYVQYKSKAYMAGYKLSNSKEYQAVWQSKHRNISSEKAMLQYAIDTGDINPVDWKLFTNHNYNTISIEQIN